MANDNLTFELGGEISLRHMVEGLMHFRSLIDGLTEELSKNANVAWIVDDLRPGSAVATIRGQASDMEAVARVVHAYAIVGRALVRDEPIPYSDRVRKAAKQIRSFINNEITSIRFETPEEEWTISSPSVKPKPTTPLSAYGAIEGRIETLTKRRGLRFILYDTLHDRAVACYLKEGQEEMMRGAWGRRAIVEGWVTRDPITGLPSTIRQVSNIEFLPETSPGSYRNARGALPFQPEGPASEDLIRRLRDA